MELPTRTERQLWMMVHTPVVIADGKSRKALRFNLSICADDDVLIDLPGWRIRRGAIEPPSRQLDGGKWWPMADLPTDRGKRALAVLVSAWASLYTDVEFPKIDEERIEENGD